ncbi:HAMP domain-containing sensor histidine kinase [soil metagenome]
MQQGTRRRRQWSLAARITALVVSVATLVGLVAAVLTLQLLRLTLEDQMRTQLRQQLEIAVEAPDDQAGIDAAITWAEYTGTLYAVIDSDGRVSGTATEFVSAELVTQIEDQNDASDKRLRPREPVILEGRQIGERALVLARSDTSIFEASRGLVLRVMPVLLLGILAAVGGGALLARRITRPLVVTAAAADRLADGERNVPMPHPDLPEVRAVADALTALDRDLAASELRQREFLLSISHEIRTPLTAIRGYGEVLADDVMPAAIAGSIIQTEAERLSRFLDDLLELARLEADDFTIAESDATLEEVLLAAEGAWRARAAVLEVQFVLELPPESVLVSTDVLRVRQVLDGLIENSLRVSPSGSSITLRLFATADRVAVTVADEGPGLSADDLDRAFDRGVLRERYQNSRPVGTGLGLSIAARLIGRLGGTISATSRPEGGAEFTVSWTAPADPAEPWSFRPTERPR